jgi:hypothetical protein
MGWPVERLTASIDRAAQEVGSPPKLTLKGVRRVLGEVLSGEGELARRKVFSRRHVVVELAPHVFGQDPRALDLLVGRALKDPEVIPLVGVAGARERPHALASVLAAEAAIANAVGRQLERSDAAVAPVAAVERAIASAERNIGAALSGEQRQAAERICGSGRGAELMVGVAGAGKTTTLAVVAAAFEAAGCSVIGAATSGQAARTLGREAELGESRTLASLLWRLDHGRLVLDERCVIILDEVGMTEDAHLVALTARVEAAGAKLVLVGDHHQLGSVGPGGALAALVGRHRDVVQRLSENRRQHDPGERGALAELRDGRVAQAVAWYQEQGRLHTAADRGGAVQEAVDAWAADLAAGHRTGLYAWRRGSVAVLNRSARQFMDATGRLSGPELVCPGGNAYRAGDWVVTLAPGAAGRLVTSQRAVVVAIDVSAETLTLCTDDGNHVRLGKEEAGSERLDYGYATTVHRCQGSTVERAHLFADGGGRELAYVAMSRARQSTQVWVVADDLPQAVDDLRRDWSTRRTPTWALDSALTARQTLTREQVQALPEEQQARLAALFHAETALAGEAIVGIGLPDRAATVGQAETSLAKARQARVDLDSGRGVWQDTDAGRAVTDLAEARRAHERAERTADHGGRWRERRAARKEAERWAQRQVEAEQRWTAHVAPMIGRLDREIAFHQASLDSAVSRFESRLATSRTVVGHGLEQQRHAANLARRLAAERHHLDGLPSAAERREAAMRGQRFTGSGPAAGHEPPGPRTAGIEM